MALTRLFDHGIRDNAEWQQVLDALNRGGAGTGASVTVNLTGGGTTVVGGDGAEVSDPLVFDVQNTSGAAVNPYTTLGWNVTTGDLAVSSSTQLAALVAVSNGMPGATFKVAFGGNRTFRPEPGTTGWKAGSPLWRSHTADGTVTNVRPSGAAQLLGQCRGLLDPVTGLVSGLFNPVLQVR